jgi:glycosyltransferase involved in cell wall biosynthesis
MQWLIKLEERVRKQMKLLYITNGINGSGGLERVLSIKASYLADNLDYDVHIAGLNDATSNLFYEFSSKIKLHNVAVSGNPIQYIKSYAFGFKNLVKQLNPDVIVVCDDGLKGFFLPTIIGKSQPIIYERHVSKNIEVRKNATVFKMLTTKIKLVLMDFLSKTFDQFVVLTKENKREWKGKNVVVISNPLSFYPEESSTLENKKVIAVGKQSHQKGYDILLKSWQKVVEKNPDWQLEIYGKNDASQGLEQLAIALSVEKNVTFFEPEKYIKEKYLDSSIYVLSSRFEGFGMVLIEAMACGVPCVSFDCPYGPSDIIANNEDGFLVENGNSDALANKLNELIENESIRKEFGKAAKENVQRFQPEIILNQWDDLFIQLYQDRSIKY